jgi:hypothetical protein
MPRARSAGLQLETRDGLPALAELAEVAGVPGDAVA